MISKDLISVYAIKDVLQDYGNNLYTFPNDDVAKRWFGQVVSSSVLPKDRGDLELWRIGNWNKETGMLNEDVYLFERVMLGSEVND